MCIIKCKIRYWFPGQVQNYHREPDPLDNTVWSILTTCSMAISVYNFVKRPRPFWPLFLTEVVVGPWNAEAPANGLPLGDSLTEVNSKEVGSSRHQEVRQEAGYEAVGMLLPSLLAQLQGNVIRLLLVLKKIKIVNRNNLENLLYTVSPIIKYQIKQIPWISHPERFLCRTQKA